MRPSISNRRQRGAALIVALIMLLMLTVLVTSSFALSGTNLKSVTNTQMHDEAVAAANAAIEQVISSPFTNSPAAESINVDLNNDGTAEYVVAFAKPLCISATQLATASLAPSDVSSSFASTTTTTYYDTVWDLDATVTPSAVDVAGGTSAHVHEGIRVQLTQSQYQAVCT
jgi:Tfp pilus assembly protein PilX